MRLFVSVDLEGVTEGVAKAQNLFGETPGLRFTDPAQVHVTLKFLGDVEEGQLPELREELASAVNDASVDPFEVTVGGLGAFPNLDHISVIWVGVHDGGAMSRLHATIEDRMTSLGFEPEEHEFT